MSQRFAPCAPSSCAASSLREHWIAETGFSFPSDHSFSAMMFALFFLAMGLSHVSDKRLWVFYLLPVWAVAVCFSPTDSAGAFGDRRLHRRFGRDAGRDAGVLARAPAPGCASTGAGHAARHAGELTVRVRGGPFPQGHSCRNAEICSPTTSISTNDEFINQVDVAVRLLFIAIPQSSRQHRKYSLAADLVNTCAQLGHFS